jgi:hypothetical protein
MSIARLAPDKGNIGARHPARKPLEPRAPRAVRPVQTKEMTHDDSHDCPGRTDRGPFGPDGAANPSAGSMSLSQVVAKLETDLSDLGHISEISWEDDGYWEVEYQTTDNREVDIRVDPATGETRER